MIDTVTEILRDLALSPAGEMPSPDAGERRPGRLWCALCDASNDMGQPWLPPARIAGGGGPVPHLPTCPYARARVLAGLPVMLGTTEQRA